MPPLVWAGFIIAALFAPWWLVLPSFIIAAWWMEP